MGVHIDEYQRSFWTGGYPLVRHLRDRNDSRTSVPYGHVIAPLRLVDTALVALLRAGDLVDVVAADAQAGQAAVVAAGARVVTIPQVPDEWARPGPEGALVLIDVDAHTASVVAQAAASATLSVIWR